MDISIIGVCIHIIRHVHFNSRTFVSELNENQLTPHGVELINLNHCPGTRFPSKSIIMCLCIRQILFKLIPCGLLVAIICLCCYTAHNHFQWKATEYYRLWRPYELVETFSGNSNEMDINGYLSNWKNGWCNFTLWNLASEFTIHNSWFNMLYVQCSVIEWKIHARFHYFAR